ncbi:MAG: hypothetical protein Q8P41_13820 [Pseudomonadota bacterium]|nr:hypothetical protein [Pseudomonadota bacterium]
MSHDDLLLGDVHAPDIGALVPHDHEPHAALAEHSHSWGHGACDAVAEPGAPDGLLERLGWHDPLAHLDTFRFPAFTLPHTTAGLVDTDGDGIPDMTPWGTRVLPVEPYVRGDGTVVEGHFRTVPDGVAWNNLNSR